MPLTPEDVGNKRFTAVRLREGYDMGEVDQFLDEVEAELTRLTAENEELRAKLESVQTGQPIPAKPQKEASKPAPEPEAPAPAPAPAAAVQPTAALERESIQVTTTADASRAATRLLELAGRNADELVAEAQEQADQILGEARSEAARLEEQSQQSVRQLEEESRDRAQQLDAETEERRLQLFGDLERQKAQLDTEVAQLRDFERKYRSELETYFEQQLGALRHSGQDGSLAPQGDGVPQG